MIATTNRYDELSSQEQLDIDSLINTIAAHRGIEHPEMRRARTSVRRATQEFHDAARRWGSLVTPMEAASTHRKAHDDSNPVHHIYEVVVGNVGTVYPDVFDDRLTDSAHAGRIYREYVRQSLNGDGRASGEDVTLMRDGEPISEHLGILDDDDI